MGASGGVAATDARSVRQQGGILVQSLDALLGKEEPHGTFHDATVSEMTYDGPGGTATLTAAFCVGDPNASVETERERRRVGVLHLEGVRVWRHDSAEAANHVPGVWLTSEGPLAEARGDIAAAIRREFAAEPYTWYFFFSDSNSFIYWVARRASFRWQPQVRPAA
jgi:hypothetical protein